MNPETPNYLPVSDSMAEQLNNLCVVVNDWATKKGWNETPDSVQHKAEQIALMHSELSECLEFVRKKPKFVCMIGQCPQYLETTDKLICPVCGENNKEVVPLDDHVPSLTGEAAELADVLIRIFHYCGKRGIDLGKAVQLKHQYNTTRPYRHGKVI
jgi:NTP pyrophosphatase (non-canonical NTP hydrolase)